MTDQKYDHIFAAAILYSEANPSLLDIPFYLDLGQKRLLSPSLAGVWKTVSYRIKTKGHKRILTFSLPKRTRKLISTYFKGGLTTKFDLTDILHIPLAYLEGYDSVHIHGSTTIKPSAPPPHMDEAPRSICVPHMHDTGRDHAPDPRDLSNDLVSNAFYRLSLSPNALG